MIIYEARRRTYDDGLEDALANGEPIVRALAPCLSLLLDKLPAYFFGLKSCVSLIKITLNGPPLDTDSASPLAVFHKEDILL